MIEDGFVNFDKLKHHSKVLTEESILIELLKKPLFKTLNETYLKGESLNLKLNSIHTYESIYKELVSGGVLRMNQAPSKVMKGEKKIYQIPTSFNIAFPTYEILNRNEFDKVRREVFKQFISLILFQKKCNILKSFLDVIAGGGTFAAAEINKIKTYLDKRSDFFMVKFSDNKDTARGVESKLKINNNYTFKKENILLYKTFYSDKAIHRYKNFNHEDFNFPVTKIFNDFVNFGFICNSVKKIEFLNLFIGKEIPPSDKVYWMGTPWDLKIFTRTMAQSNSIQKLDTQQQWFVASHCFKVKFKGMNEPGNIPKYESLSKSKISKKDNTTKLEELCGKLISLFETSK
ncbi:hypothetical protein ERX46_05465 [Brumimicrobium glaciale]|uniref:Uncharacterized protein n=1 Tax=Brumimicrobium glaciale TaxID=200475 RepID=A0A4Q4KQG3_9FLAO|nr:hypothetical protein [Brumimicrobium glaciale]RYM34824.1 hypothetical protein ERX46_05465 [Brumimicrobium glaciale]